MSDAAPSLLVLGLDETPEQRAEVEAQAKILAGSMLEVEIAAFAIRASSRIAELELAKQRLEQTANLSLRDHAIQLRDRVEVHIRDLKPLGDRLPVSRDLLGRVIELLT